MIIDGEIRCGICGILGAHASTKHSQEATVASAVAHRLYAQLKDRLSEEERQAWDREHTEFLEFEVWLHVRDGVSENREEREKRDAQVDRFIMKNEAVKAALKEVPMR